MSPRLSGKPTLAQPRRDVVDYFACLRVDESDHDFERYDAPIRAVRRHNLEPHAFGLRFYEHDGCQLLELAIAKPASEPDGKAIHGGMLAWHRRPAKSRLVAENPTVPQHFRCALVSWRYLSAQSTSLMTCAFFT
ncbi:MAG: hypothetical protein FJX52_07030 [Alphaproteobacteria bacterium]|nr:hypothetical protein [Alphaproteobacteria bacterium]